MSGRDISIVIPFYNEADNVIAVLQEVLRFQPSAEVIAIDDGSNDSTWAKICTIDGVVAIQLPQNRGQSAAILTGLNRATRPICVVMDGDGQNDPADIENLVAHLPATDAAFGYRQVRKDNWNKRLGSKIGNSIRRLFTGDNIRDTGCSLKAFNRELVQSLPPLNGVHRFMGFFFRERNYQIVEVPVNHRPRRSGTSKYNNLGRALRGIYDLVGVCWYAKRRVDTGID